MGRTAPPFLRARTRPSTLQTTHPPRLVRHLNTTPTGTASTGKCASAPHSESYHDRKVIYSSPPATLSSPASSGSAPSAPPYFPTGYICGTWPATACGGSPKSLIVSPLTPPRINPTSFGSLMTLDPSRSTSSRQATPPPTSPTMDPGVCIVTRLGA